MSNSYRLQFSALNNNVDKNKAKTFLIDKLKLTETKAEQFFAGKLIFSPISYDKAIKQQKTFAALGINVVIIDVFKNNSSAESTMLDVDQRILTALDYITTSIIRLEEKVDDLARQQQVQNGEEVLELKQNADWVNELEFEDEQKEPSTSRNMNWLFIMLFFVLLLLLALAVAFPNLLPV